MTEGNDQRAAHVGSDPAGVARAQKNGADATHSFEHFTPGPANDQRAAAVGSDPAGVPRAQRDDQDVPPDWPGRLRRPGRVQRGAEVGADPAGITRPADDAGRAAQTGRAANAEQDQDAAPTEASSTPA